jgi:hypothetical protein
MKENIIIEKESIDYFENIANEVIEKVFLRNPNTTMVTDLTTVLDFSITQEELDRDIETIDEKFGINLKINGDYTLLSLCKLIDEKRNIKIH